MSNQHFQLLKIPSKHTPHPDAAKAYIALIRSSKEKVGEEVFTTIPVECRTLREVEEVADWLIKELEAVKRQAATFFGKEEKNRQNIANKS